MALEYINSAELPSNLDTAIKHLAKLKPADPYFELIANLTPHTTAPKILSDEIIPPPPSSSSDLNRTNSNSNTPDEIPIIYSPIDNETIGSLHTASVFYKNETSDVSTFFVNEFSEQVKEYTQCKINWLAGTQGNSQDVPKAFTVIQNSSASKIKFFDRVFLSSKNNIGDVYTKLSEAQFAAIPKPKGTNQEIIRRLSQTRNRLSGALENVAFEKIDNIFDNIGKNINVEEGDFVVWQAAPQCFNVDKNKYEYMQGQLKTAVEMIDIYADIIKRYPFIKYIINPFREEHAEQQQRLVEKLSEQELEVCIKSDDEVEEVGQSNEKANILSVTSDSKIHCKSSLNWFHQKPDTYKLVLMDALSNYSKYT